MKPTLLLSPEFLPGIIVEVETIFQKSGMDPWPLRCLQLSETRAKKKHALFVAPI
jgi:hypothetical protein